MSKKPLVGIVMGSNSDWETMQHAAQMLEQFGITHEAQVLSAHRMPDDMFQYAEQAQANGLQAIMAKLDADGGVTDTDYAATFATYIVD